MSVKSNPELTEEIYPVNSNVVKTYLEYTPSVYPYFIGDKGIKFSLESYQGNKAPHPSNEVTVLLESDKIYSKDELESLIKKLNLTIENFENWLKYSGLELT